MTETARWYRHCPVCGDQRLRPLKAYGHAHLVRCSNCTLTFAGRAPTEAELEAHYRDYGQWNDSPITRARYRELLESFEPYRLTNRLLDIGCGSGLFLDEARARGWQVRGSEYSERALEKLRARGLDVTRAPVTHATFAAHSFDVVTAFEVFEHVRDPMHEGAIVAHVIRAGGLLYCTTPNFNSISRRMLGARWSLIEYPEHLWYFTSRTLRAWLGRLGFVPEEVTSSGISVLQLRGAAPFPSGSVPAPSAAYDEELRSAIERSRVLRTAKAAVNGGLSMLGAGDTLKAYFRLGTDRASGH
jgi:2-polyprenyl-3-methyl-5-hydroxy-6-metoxy-1,4-benzoquinol methylase